MENIGNLAIFVGKNGSGKTNILEILNHFFNDFHFSGGAPSTLFNSNNVWYRKRPSNISGGGAIEVTLKIKLEHEESVRILGNENFLKTLKDNYDEDFDEITICRQIENPSTPWITKFIKIGNITMLEDDTVITAEELNISLEKARIKESVVAEEIIAYFFHPVVDEPDFSKKHFILLKNKAYPSSRYARKLIKEGKIRYAIIPDKELETWVVEKKLKYYKNPISRRLIVSVSEGKPLIEITEAELHEIIADIERLVSNHFIYIPANRDMKSMPDTRVSFIDQESIINPFCKLIDRELPAQDEETYRKILDKIKGFIESDLHIDQSTNEISIWEGGHRYSLKNLGGGIQVIIGFMYQIYSAPKNSIFAIEEPEIHLHSEFSRILFNLLKEEADINQIILTTHLPKFIDQTSIENNWKVSKENSRTHIKRLQSEEDLVEVLDDLGARPQDRLYPNKILLCCETERIVLSTLAKVNRHNIDGVLIPLASDFDHRKIEIYANLVKDTQTLLFLVLDIHGKEIVNEAVSKGYVKEENCLTLEGTIEDIYPPKILAKVLRKTFNVKFKVEDLKIPMVESIQGIQGVPGTWKTYVGKAVAEQWSNDIPKEIIDIIKKLESK